MKRLALLILLISGTIVIAGLTGCSSKNRANATSRPGAVSDSTGSVSVILPQGWTVNKSGLMGTIIALLGPQTNGFTPNITLVTENAQGLPLADYVALSEKNMPKMIRDFSVISTTNCSVDGVEGKSMVYRGTMGQNNVLKFKQVYCIYDGQAYVFTYTSLPEYFDTSVTVFDSVLAGLKWLK